MTLDVAQEVREIYTGADSDFRLAFFEIDPDAPNQRVALDMTGWDLEVFLVATRSPDAPLLVLTSADADELEAVDESEGLWDLHFTAEQTVDLEPGTRRLLVRGTEPTGELRIMTDEAIVVRRGPEAP